MAARIRMRCWQRGHSGTHNCGAVFSAARSQGFEIPTLGNQDGFRNSRIPARVETCGRLFLFKTRPDLSLAFEDGLEAIGLRGGARRGLGRRFHSLPAHHRRGLRCCDPPAFSETLSLIRLQSVPV